MMNPITELTGNEFLLFYGVLIVATLLVSWWWARTSDPTAGMPVPAVPREPDPYEIAYLRGGENELTRVVIVALTQRGYLRVVQEEKGLWQSSSDPEIEQTPGHPDVDELCALERAVFDWFRVSHTVAEVFEKEEVPGIVASHCLDYEERLQREQLLTPEGESDATSLTFFYGAAVIVGVGILRLFVGLTRGEPVGFLVMMGLFGVGFLGGICTRDRLSRRGQRYLKQVQTGLEWLKSSASTLPTGSPSLILLVGAFGVAALALADTSFSYFRDMFQQGTSSSYGGCGGGDGGCGGCG